jgi:hypothetical protein
VSGSRQHKALTHSCVTDTNDSSDFLEVPHKITWNKWRRMITNFAWLRYVHQGGDEHQRCEPIMLHRTEGMRELERELVRAEYRHLSVVKSFNNMVSHQHLACNSTRVSSIHSRSRNRFKSSSIHWEKSLLEVAGILRPHWLGEALLTFPSAVHQVGMICTP